MRCNFDVDFVTPVIYITAYFPTIIDPYSIGILCFPKKPFGKNV